MVGGEELSRLGSAEPGAPVAPDASAEQWGRRKARDRSPRTNPIPTSGSTLFRDGPSSPNRAAPNEAKLASGGAQRVFSREFGSRVGHGNRPHFGQGGGPRAGTFARV